MLKYKIIAICCFALAFIGPSAARAQDWFHAGPLYDHFKLTLEAGDRREALGPLFYWEQAGTQRTWALPPLFGDVTDPAIQMHEYDIGYPVLTYRKYGTESRWQFIQIFSFAGGGNGEGQEQRRVTIFPLYFQQRSPNPDENYTAVGPFYGHLKNRLFRDSIFFVMFPMFSETHKADIVTDNYVYPIFSLRHGNGLKGWKLWPIAGHEHKDVTTKTNGFGDVETVAGHDSWFVLWPIYLEQHAGIGTKDPEHEVAVLPLYSLVRSPKRDSTTVIWPFFSHITDREKNYREWQLPWPLVEFARGPGKTTSRVWPFYSQSHNTNLVSNWYLWPVYKYNRFHADPDDRSRTRILLFLYSDTKQKNTETGKSRRRIDFWPLFTHKRDFNGNTRLQIFAPLEPILPFAPAIERDDSPLWSVWRAEKNPTTGATSQSLLWNLYRHARTPESKQCSFLFGLFQYESGANGKRVRLFYIPIVKTKPAGPH